jgi:hypothetical protein
MIVVCLFYYYYLQGMNVIEVAVSCVLKTCEVFIQPQPIIVKYIEQYLQAIQSEIMTQQPLHFLDTTEMYVTFCPDLSHMAKGDIVPTQQGGATLARVNIKKPSKYLSSAQQNTEVFFVDYGWSASVNTAMLKKLKTPLTKDLLKIPHQVCLYLFTFIWAII